MKIEQFTYTGSPWGAMAPGWTIFQSSPGVGSDTASALKPFFQFTNYQTGDDDSPEEINGHRLPVRLVFATVPETGQRIVAQSLDAGLRWYDQTRGRDYFAHVFVESQADGGVTSKALSFNPVALFLSPSFQTEFPHEFRDEALRILNGDRANGPTPELATLDSLENIRQNEWYSDDAVFERISPAAIANLGRLGAALVNGGASIFFDATKGKGIDLLAAGVRLLPLTLRTKLAFSTWIPQKEIQTFPRIKNLAFVGTVRADVAANPDTGLYGELPEGGPEFKSREDVELFKRMVDAGGTRLGAEDFDDLVSSWQVAAGRTADLARVRAAAKFADRFPGLKDEVASGLASAFADYNHGRLPREMKIVGVVAGYELGFDSFRSDISGTLDEFIRDSALFTDALRTLEVEKTRATFLDAVFEAAQREAALDGLARMLRGLDVETRRIVSETTPNGRIAKFAALIDRMNGIRRNVMDKLVPPGNAQATLNEIDDAERNLGAIFGDMDEVRNRLHYLMALNDVHEAIDLTDFADKAKFLGIDMKTIRADALDRVKPGLITAERLAGALTAFEDAGVTKDALLHMAIEAAEARGRNEGEREGERRAQEAEARAERAERHTGVPNGVALAFAVLSLAIGLAAGTLLASRFPAGENGVRDPPAPSFGENAEDRASSMPVRQEARDDRNDVPEVGRTTPSTGDQGSVRAAGTADDMPHGETGNEKGSEWRQEREGRQEALSAPVRRIGRRGSYTPDEEAEWQQSGE